MAPTKSVSAALHSELSEYASLLRAIRTNSTLDIVPQLRKAHFDNDEDEYDEDSFESEEDAPRGDVQIPGPSAKSRANTSVASKGKKEAVKTPRKPRRKHNRDWTQWPLLHEHCPAPEWGFDEEVKTIVEQCLREIRQQSSVGASIHSCPSTPGDDQDESIDLPIPSPAYLAGLTADAAFKLSSLFSLMASHRPVATFAKHGRLAPFDWEDILEVVGVSDIFGKEVVLDVKRRMESVFGPSNSQVVHHMEVLNASKRVLEEAEASLGESITSLIGLPPHRKKRRTKKQTHEDTDTPGHSSTENQSTEQLDRVMDINEPE